LRCEKGSRHGHWLSHFALQTSHLSAASPAHVGKLDWTKKSPRLRESRPAQHTQGSVRTAPPTGGFARDGLSHIRDHSHPASALHVSPWSSWFKTVIGCWLLPGERSLHGPRVVSLLNAARGFFYQRAGRSPYVGLFVEISEDSWFSLQVSSLSLPASSFSPFLRPSAISVVKKSC